MIRRIAFVLFVPWLAFTAWGQGISGVTRRTPTLEKQAAARRFLDASGVVMTNSANVATSPRPGVVRPAMAVRPPPVPRANLAVRPAVVRTNAIAIPSKTQPARAHGVR
ncbi:MAG: hypothetical protein JNK85_12960 [Verrucomicrobiales bacterium]|nr:hypothetical protein [Verrucomicrobiales bacterium]